MQWSCVAPAFHSGLGADAGQGVSVQEAHGIDAISSVAPPRRRTSASHGGKEAEHREQPDTLNNQKSAEGTAPGLVLPDVEAQSRRPTGSNAEGSRAHLDDSMAPSELKQAGLEHRTELPPDTASAGGSILATDFALSPG